jgi:hypothetical protein
MGRDVWARHGTEKKSETMHADARALAAALSNSVVLSQLASCLDVEYPLLLLVFQLLVRRVSSCLRCHGEVRRGGGRRVRQARQEDEPAEVRRPYLQFTSSESIYSMFVSWR